jgi:arabinose-5-phosphate isomerase
VTAAPRARAAATATAPATGPADTDPPSVDAQADAQRSAAIVALGRTVIHKERLALEHVESRLGDSFAAAVLLIARSRGRVIVAGVGKSGLIGRKIAATLTSTGTPATFLHPVDSAHGDLGLVGTDDTAILISKSGESTELMVLLDQLQRLGVRTIAITGAPQSMLGRHCDVVLDAAVDEEACPHDLAPTTSTTAALAVGDALAVALLSEKGFRREDFARLHPGGPLGKKLLTRVADVMVRADLPLLGPTATMREAVVQLAERRGIVMVVDDDRCLSGVVTVGDLTRLMQRDTDWQVVTVVAAMTRTPRTAREDELGSAAVYRMEHHGIMALPVVDASGRVEGVVHLHDLMQAGSA